MPGRPLRSTMSAESGDMGEILQAIREVRLNLDRRAARAFGATTIVWGVSSALVFAFYQLVMWNPAPYEAALGPFLLWVWVLPVGVGYAATVVLGAQIGRIEPKVAKPFLVVGAGVLVGVLALLGLLFAGEFRRVPGLWLFVLGAIILLRLRIVGERPGPARAFAVGLATVSIASGAALLVVPFLHAGLVATVVFGVGLTVMGTLKFHAG